MKLLNRHVTQVEMLPYRLVCSLWNSTIVWSDWWNEPYVLDTPAPSLVSSFFTLNVGSQDFERFSTKFGSQDNLPLPLCFSQFVAPNNLSLNDPSTMGFLDGYGKWIKRLELYRCRWTLEDLRHVLFDVTENLEMLKIVCGVIPGTQEGRGGKFPFQN